MQIAKATGRNAAVLKYDLLTALGAHACGADKHVQRLTLRLITLIVARYNWQSDLLSIGQREIAALWAIDERSVKREMARLRALGWLVVHRPAARGRVATYGLDIPAILEATRPAWPRIGSDFVHRLTGKNTAEPAAPSNIVAFPAPAGGQGLWPRMQAILHREDPHLYQSWFAALQADSVSGGLLTLNAPSRFHASYIEINHASRLLAIARSLEPDTRRIEILALS